MTDKDFPSSYSMFSNIHGYLGLPLTRDLDAADVFVVGLPYDLGTSGRSGTREGPLGIRTASAQLRWEENRWPWTFDLFERLRVADYGDLEFLIVAAGRPRMITAEMVKPGAVVVDVGMHRTDSGLVGDVDFHAVREVAGLITPVPGGVGPLTVTMLLSNTLEAARACVA